LPEKIIPLFITNLLENKKVPVYGTGENVRDWIYVMDNCSGIKTVLDRGKSGEIYNIGCGQELSNINLTRAILKLMGKDEHFILPVPDRPGHDFRYSINTDKINKLGWMPRKQFDYDLLHTVEWYKDNEKWWKGKNKGV
jgi:dTDP-glucose 4,6-dehydratase